MDRDEMMELFGAMAKVEVKLHSINSKDTEIMAKITEARQHQIAANDALRASIHNSVQEVK